MKSGSKWMTGLAVAALLIALAFAVNVTAQVQSESTTTHGTASKVVKVERGEVLLVEGNDLVIKMEDGSIRHIPNVPETSRVTVGGRELGIHDLKAGMKLEKTITTTTTPRTITTVQTVSGKVFHVMPPNSVTLTMDNGENQTFKIPKGQKFNIDGKETDAFGLKKGMKVSATKVVEVPETVVTQHAKLSGTMPPPPPAPPADTPILIVMAPATPAPAATETAAATPAPAAKLPKTGSELPLIGLLGLVCVCASFALKLVRGN